MTVSPSETVVDLMFKMINENVGAVVVVDEGRAAGIITEKDVLERVIMREKDVYETRAKDVMSKPLVSIEADRPIKEGLELMQKNKVKRLAVTENGSLIGLVTEKRLLEAIVKWGYSIVP
ncbi:CBS domain-containing protein [Candidatus Bathyarchaeota archaeon]|nr:CBS domain-containing protein [Candidatus Bathyarchaeota archaeon]